MKLAGLLVVLLASSFCLSFGGLLPNGDFEESPIPTQLSGTKVEGNNAIPKWSSKGYVEFIKAGTKQGDMLLVVPHGNSAVRLGNDGSIRQKVRVQKGKFYAVTFSFARTCSQEEVLKVIVSSNHNKDDSGELPLQTIYNNLGHDTYAWGFRAAASVIEITFHNVGHPGEDHTCGPILDTIALTILDLVKPTGGNLVKNGDFGQGPYVFHSSATGVLIPPNVQDNHSPLPAWMIKSSKAIKYIDNLHFFVPQGQRAVELVGGMESAIAQHIRTVPGTTYVLTFLVGDARNGCVGPLAIQAFAGKAETTVKYISKGTGGSVKGLLLFKAEKRVTTIRFISLSYTMDSYGSMCGPVLDDVKVLIARPRSRIHS